MQQVLLALIIVLCLCLSSTSAACVDNATYSLASDRSYWYGTDQKKDQLLWKEWWFFALTDAASGYSFIAAYAIVDPNATLPINAALESMTYPPGGDNWQTHDVFPMSELRDSPANASLTLGTGNYISVINTTTYRVVGRSGNGDAAWDLYFSQRYAPLELLVQINDTGLDMGWLSYMPSADVVGSLTLKGTTVPIDGTGYHDHNWGIYTSLMNWIWLQLNDGDLALVFAGYKIPFTNDVLGEAWLRFLDSRTGQPVRLKLGTSCEDHVSFHSLKSVKRFGFFNDSIENSVVISSSGGWSVTWQYAMQTEQINEGGLGFPLVVFEQLSLFNGTLSQNGTVVRTFGGIGFSEWCDNHPVATPMQSRDTSGAS